MERGVLRAAERTAHRHLPEDCDKFGSPTIAGRPGCGDSLTITSLPGAIGQRPSCPRTAKRKVESMMQVCSSALLAVVLAVTQTPRAGAAAEGANPPLTDVGIASAWRTLRAVDCARCHGKH